MEHSFDVNIAKEYGIHAAIILKYIYFWIKKNEANERHFYEGTFWTYNSVKAMTELFPYMSKNTIVRVMEKLEEEGLIITGSFNSTSYDRTKWYALTDLGKSIFEKAEIDLPKSRNGITQSQKPIPFNNTYNNTNNNNGDCADSGSPDVSTSCTSDVNLFFEEMWKLYPLKKGKGDVSESRKNMLLKQVGREQFKRCIERYIDDHNERKNSGKFCPEWMYGSSFFNSGYIDYLDENYVSQSEVVADSYVTKGDRQ